MKAILKGLLGILGIALLGLGLANTQKVAKQIETNSVSEFLLSGERQLASYSLRQGMFDEAYLKASETPALKEVGNVRGLLVPHHLLASTMIAQAFNAVPKKSVKTVILISPDHFGQIREPYVTTKLSWKTPYGPLDADRELIGRISEVISESDNAFSKEHGITGIIPFVKRSFPGARVVPIMVSDFASRESLDRLAAALPMSDDTLVVASFDFSHYLPQNVANYHDETARAVLDTLDSDRALRLDIDSRTGLALMLKLMKREQASFEEIGHSSADTITSNPDSLENTSYFTGVFADVFAEQTKQTIKPAITLNFFGDIMLDRRVRKTLDTAGSVFPLESLSRFMMGSDRVVANLEGPFTTNKTVATSDNLVFTFDPKHAPTLRKYGITTVSLANNHMLNFGAAGVASTKETLKKVGIQYFGDPSNQKELSYIDDVHGVKVAYVGYHQFSDGYENILGEIKRVRPLADVVIVWPHWGVEYEIHTATTRTTREAHAFIDAGADLVMGGHPHVVQPIEIYKGKAIFYSLGNFIFDQQFSDDVKTELSVGMVWHEDRTDFYLFPLEHDDFKIRLSAQPKRDILLERISKDSNVPDEIKSLIKTGMFTIPH